MENGSMEENREYQMAIDLLRCHLGLSEEEARAQLGLDMNAPSPSYTPINVSGGELIDSLR